MKSPRSFIQFSDKQKQIIFWLPVVVFALYAISWLHPWTRKVTLWALKESHPVEVLTFLILLAGGILGFHFTFYLKRIERARWPVYFYAVFSVTLLFVAMEEIAWGQQFFHFSTPEAWKKINVQEELTLHNLMGVQGRSEIFHLAFALFGLLGIWLGHKNALRIIGVSSLLFSWLIIITIVSSVDVYNDFFPINEIFDRGMQRTSELIELFIGTTGLLYVALNYQRMLRSNTG